MLITVTVATGSSLAGFPRAYSWGTGWLGIGPGNGLAPGKLWGSRCLPHVCIQYVPRNMHTVFALLCFVVVIHWLFSPYPSGLLHWLALWQSNDCPSASKATLMNMDKYFMWIHYERLHNHNKAKHNKTVCIFLGIYCTCVSELKPSFGQLITWTPDILP